MFTPLVTTTVSAEWTLLQGSFETPTCELRGLMVVEMGRLGDDEGAIANDRGRSAAARAYCRRRPRPT